MSSATSMPISRSTRTTSSILLGQVRRVARTGRGRARTTSKATSIRSGTATSTCEHVNGQCQLFRRECFEEIGGYVPIKGGGIDWVAVTTARMKGWKTRSFDERVFHHHRKMGTAGTQRARRAFPLRQEGLLSRRPPAVAGVPRHVPDERSDLTSSAGSHSWRATRGVGRHGSRGQSRMS